MADLTPDAVNVYVSSGPKAIRLSRFSREQVEDGSTAPTIECTFPAPKTRKSKKKTTAEEAGEDDDNQDATPKPTKKKPAKRTAKGSKPIIDEEKDLALGSDEDEDDYFALENEIVEAGPSTDGLLPSSEPGPAEWVITKPAGGKRPTASKSKKALDSDIMELSD